MLWGKDYKGAQEHRPLTGIDFREYILPFEQMVSNGGHQKKMLLSSLNEFIFL